MKQNFYVLLSVFLFSSSYGQESISITAILNQKLDSIADGGPIVGFSVAIVDAETTLYTRGFGYADARTKTPFTSQTIQNIASISKTVIGIALIKAQELGKLDLDDPINKYLPFSVSNPHFPEVSITIRQLASHTSTIKDAAAYEKKGYVLRYYDNAGTKLKKNFRPPNELMDYGLFLEEILGAKGKWYSKKNFIQKRPGEIFEYSNVGAGLAALVLQRAVGQSFSEFTKTHVFEPLGMSQTGWFLSEVDAYIHSTIYTDKGKPIAPYQLINYPDGGLITSSTDLAIYLTELISGYSGDGTLLSIDGYSELFKPNLETAIHKSRSNSKYNDEFEMGIFMGISAQNQVGHTGGDPGVTTMLFFDVKSKIGKLLLVNTELSKDGINELIKIWKTLEAYETKL